MDYRILGPLEVVSDGTAADLGAPKQRAVLAILLLQAGEIVPSDRLIELVWGSNPPRTAAHSVQIYVSELRKVLDPLAGRPVIATRGSGYALQADPESIDVRRFERLVAEGTRALDAGDHARGVDALRAAMALWRGAPLADFAYDEFAQAHIRRLSGLRLDALEQLASAELSLGREQEVLTLVETVIGAEPLRERARELQMIALYRSGRAPEALRAYQEFRRLLADELGLDPTPTLRRLEERILLHDPSLAVRAAEEGGAGSSAPRNPYKGLRSFAERDAGDFFGRESLTARLTSELAGGARLVTLVGPSGSGKSSVVAAGLIPALRQGAVPGSDAWLIVRMTPGRHPFEELKASLLVEIPDGVLGPTALEGEDDGVLRAVLDALPADVHLLLVVDQFEELFTTVDERERERFLQALSSALEPPDGPIRVVLTLRADFYDRPLLHAEFGPLFAASVVNVLPMTAEELEAAIREPARRVGIDVEPWPSSFSTRRPGRERCHCCSTRSPTCSTARRTGR